MNINLQDVLASAVLPTVLGLLAWYQFGKTSREQLVLQRRVTDLEERKEARDLKEAHEAVAKAQYDLRAAIKTLREFLDQLPENPREALHRHRPRDHEELTRLEQLAARAQVEGFVFTDMMTRLRDVNAVIAQVRDGSGQTPWSGGTRGFDGGEIQKWAEDLKQAKEQARALDNHLYSLQEARQRLLDH